MHAVSNKQLNCYINLFLIRLLLFLNQMPNWDDEFDLDDYNKKKPPTKPKPQQKINNDDDFFDLDDPAPTKLPTIPAKPAKQAPAAQKSKNSYDYEQIYEEVEEVKSPPKQPQNKPVEKSNYYQQLDFEEEEVKPTLNKQSIDIKKQAIKQPLKPVKRDEDEEEFYESLEDNKPQGPSKSQPQSAKKEDQYENNYEEEFDEYGQDFEQIEEKPVKEVVLAKKSQTTANLKPKGGLKQPEKVKTQEKKLVINTNKVFTNKEEKQKEKPVMPPPKPPMKENNKQPSKKNIEPPKNLHNAISQQKPLQKSSSKRSLQSNDSRKYLSNSKVRRHTAEATPSRHLDLVQKQFPDDEQRINEYAPDKLSKLNEQVREMIRRFNEELNQLINRNMILLKDKPVERTRNVEEKQRMLEEQLKSGAIALEVVENDLQRLRGREGELREEEYQLIVEKQIEQAKQSIKQMGKLVTRLKAEVTSEGNKLNRQEVERKQAQQLHQIKLMLIQNKKQEEKYEAKLEKVTKMVEDLESKNSDKDYELSEQIDNARDKGITLNIKEGTRKRYQQLKLKITTLENHKRVTEGLAKSKYEHLNHQNDQIRNTLRSMDSQITNLRQSLEHSQDQSIKLIKKAKENPKLASALVENLDKIMKSIEENQALNYYEVRTEGNKSQASQRPLKNSMYQNMTGKEKPTMRGNSSKKEPGSANRQKIDASPQPPAPSNDEINLMKPNFMKKKEKHEANPIEDSQKTNKLYERVWKEEEEKRKQQEEKKKAEEERKKEEALKQAAAEQEKKKPFNLKKNRMNNDQKEKSIEPSPEISKISDTIELKIPVQEPKDKEEQKPSIGPKFMRLNKRGKDAQASKNDISVEKPIQEIKKPIIEEIHPKIEHPKLEHPKIEPKKEEEQPAFVPKRFNLRNKIEKKDEGYVPTVEKSIEVKKEQVKPEVKVEIKKEEKKEYAPNFSFKEEDPFKIPKIEGQKVENDIKIEVPQQKPRFNLRLRDRQKKEAQQAYVPSRLTEVVESKPKAEGGYNPFDREPIKKEEPKPYIPSKIIQDKPIKLVAEVVPTKENSKQANLNVIKEPINNPYAQVAKEQPITNPYAPKEDAPKREREGPLKKNKLLNKGPKEKINIYQQAQDITEPHHIPTNEPQHQPVTVIEQPKQINLAKTDELDLNAMLGIKKKEKANDLDDLLGQVAVGKKKQRKKNTDFFNDLEL